MRVVAVTTTVMVMGAVMLSLGGCPADSTVAGRSVYVDMTGDGVVNEDDKCAVAFADDYHVTFKRAAYGSVCPVEFGVDVTLTPIMFRGIGEIACYADVTVVDPVTHRTAAANFRFMYDHDSIGSASIREPAGPRESVVVAPGVVVTGSFKEACTAYYDAVSIELR